MPSGIPPGTKCRICGDDARAWDHCHECEVFRGYLCTRCNIVLSEHIIPLWDAATDYVKAHECAPRLIDVPARTRRPEKRRDGQVTHKLHMGNGAGDKRYIMASDSHQYLTLEQLACALDLRPGTVRDMVRERHGDGVRKVSVILVPVDEAIEMIAKRAMEKR